MRIRVPEGNVRVPLAEFEAVWTEAEQRLRAQPGSRYLGGVCAACRWVSGHPDAVSPLYREPVRATPDLITREDMLAFLTYRRVDGGDLTIHEDWAAGVAMALGWARGALTASPLLDPRDRPR